jgi:hypothetical protein
MPMEVPWVHDSTFESCIHGVVNLEKNLLKPGFGQVWLVFHKFSILKKHGRACRSGGELVFFLPLDGAGHSGVRGLSEEPDQLEAKVMEAGRCR